MTPTTDILSRQALVLNRNWQPIHVTTVVRALLMLWNDSARVVDAADYRLYSWEQWLELPVREGMPCIRTGRARLRVPEVLALARYDRLPFSAVTFSRRNVAKRDHYTCQYCGSQPGSDALTVDHVVPRSQGGQTSRPATRATPARPTELPTRPACACASSPSAPTGSRLTPCSGPAPARRTGYRAGPSSCPRNRPAYWRERRVFPSAGQFSGIGVAQELVSVHISG
ncbi:MAG: HNH endonuclease [Isosphaeraceae bacterium]